MGLFDKKSVQPVRTLKPHEVMPGTPILTFQSGEVLVDVVGTSRFQDAANAMAGRYAGDQDKDGERTVFLVREPDDNFDPFSITVWLEGWGRIGRISRDDTPSIATNLDKQLAGIAKSAGIPAMRATAEYSAMFDEDEENPRSHPVLDIEITLLLSENVKLSSATKVGKPSKFSDPDIGATSPTSLVDAPVELGTPVQLKDPSLPPAAWYDDPATPGQYRYWDGAVWTPHTAPK
jgi:hypothetical protein